MTSAHTYIGKKTLFFIDLFQFSSVVEGLSCLKIGYITSFNVTAVKDGLPTLMCTWLHVIACALLCLAVIISVSECSHPIMPRYWVKWRLQTTDSVWTVGDGHLYRKSQEDVQYNLVQGNSMFSIWFELWLYPVNIKL